MDLYPIQIMQLEKAIGELRGLYSLWYDASECGGDTYKRIKPMIEAFTKELKDNCGSNGRFM